MSFTSFATYVNVFGIAESFLSSNTPTVILPIHTVASRFIAWNDVPIRGLEAAAMEPQYKNGEPDECNTPSLSSLNASCSPHARLEIAWDILEK